MATPSAPDRANRRRAANAARNSAPAASTTPDVLADVMQDSAEIDVGAPDSAETPTPASPIQGSPNLSRERALSESPRRVTPLAVVEEDLTRKIDQSDLIMPKLRISQAMSATNRRFSETKGKDGVAMGSWYHSTSGQDLGDVVYFIPVDMRKSRAMFVQGQGLVCRSFDLLHGEGDPGIECEGTIEERHTVPENERGCAFRLWKREEGGKNTPPPCGVTYNFPGLIVVDIEDPEKTEILTAMLQLRSTGARAAKAIITHVMNLGDGTWSNVVIELGVDGRTNTKGTFYTPTADFYDTSDTLPSRITRRAAAFARQMGSVDLRASIENDPDSD